MPCNDYLSFKKIEHYGKPDVIRNIEVNLKHYFDWGFLKIGAWTNIDASSSGIYGQSFARLRPVDDGGYGDNYVFGAIRKDWVYETGVDYKSPSVPISTINYNAAESQNQVFTAYSHSFSSGDSVTIINNSVSVYTGTHTVLGSSGSQSFYIDSALNSGVGSDGSVYATYNPITPIIYSGGTPYSSSDYTINYPLGQVVFNTAQTVAITADYSYRQVQVYLADDMPWFYEAQYDSLDPSKQHWTQTANSGDFAILAQNRIQMPAIVIEAGSSRTFRPYQIGDARNIIRQNMKLHVISQNKYERDNIVDILAKQKDSHIWLYDEAKVNSYGVYSLDYNGDINANGLNYPDFVNSSLYRYTQAKIDSVDITNMKNVSNQLFLGMVTWGVQAVV